MRRKTAGRETRSAERGQALILVMLVLLVVAVLGTAAITLAASHRQTAARQRNLVQAYYAADAGVERALVMITQNPTGSYNFSFGPLENVPCSGGSIEKVTVEEPPELKEGPGRGLKITSVGTFRTARKTLIVKVRVYTPGDLLKGVSIFPPAPDHLQKITGNFTLTGESGKPRPVFLIDGSLDVRGATQKHIDAGVYASGSIEGLTGSNIHPHYPAIPPFPVLDASWYEKKAREADQYYSGGDGKKDYTKSFTEICYNGVYFVDGNVQISGKRKTGNEFEPYSGKAVIVATGDIEVTGDLQAKDGNRENNLLILISLNPGGRVDVENHAVDALIISNGTFSAQGNAQLFGGIIARQLDPNGCVTITCDPTSIESNRDLLGLAFDYSSNSPAIRIESWSE